MYGIIEQGELVIVDEGYEGAKPVIYADVPEFDQTTHYVIQTAPVDMGDHIFAGVEIRELEIDDEPIDEDMPIM